MASESGRGQTDCSNVVGVRTGMCSTKFRRTAWEGRPEDVRVMYPKNEVRYRYPEYLRTRGIRREDGGPPSKPKYYLMTDSGAVL